MDIDTRENEIRGWRRTAEGNGDSMTGSDARIDHASRMIKASAGRIYEAFVDPEALVRWLPPAGATGRIDAFEPRPGGAFCMTLVFPESASGVGKTTRNTDVVKGRFVDLEFGERIVLQIEFASADPAFAGTMVMAWTFAPVTGGASVSIAAMDIPPGIRAEDHQAGLTSTLANLARFVESNSPQA